jgi:hypothetical protein
MEDCDNEIIINNQINSEDNKIEDNDINMNSIIGNNDNNLIPNFDVNELNNAKIDITIENEIPNDDESKLNNTTNDELKLKRKTELLDNKESSINKIKKLSEDISNCEAQKEMCNITKNN